MLHMSKKKKKKACQECKWIICWTLTLYTLSDPNFIFDFEQAS